MQKEAALHLISSGKDFLISDTAIIETTYALSEYYKVPRQEVARAVYGLNDNPHLVLSYDIFDKCFWLYITHGSLSIEDCYMAAKAELNKALPLWTFDKKLARQASGLAELVTLKSLT